MLVTRTLRTAVLVAAFAPALAFAQARNGNVYDGTAHQPTAGVATEEKNAGVAPPPQVQANENRTLGTLDNELLTKAHQDAKSAPSVGNVYGTQSGGVVQISPATGK